MQHEDHRGTSDPTSINVQQHSIEVLALAWSRVVSVSCVAIVSSQHNQKTIVSKICITPPPLHD